MKKILLLILLILISTNVSAVIEIIDVTARPSSGIEPDTAILVNGFIKNTYDIPINDVIVRAYIPALGISSSDLIDTISEVFPDNYVETEELYMRIPATAQCGTYEIIFETVWVNGTDFVVERIFGNLGVCGGSADFGSFSSVEGSEVEIIDTRIPDCIAPGRHMQSGMSLLNTLDGFWPLKATIWIPTLDSQDSEYVVLSGSWSTDNLYPHIPSDAAEGIYLVRFFVEYDLDGSVMYTEQDRAIQVSHTCESQDIPEFNFLGIIAVIGIVGIFVWRRR